jgi:hypothetical protein
MGECLVGRGERVVATKVITSTDPPRKGHAEAMSSMSPFQVMPCRMGWDAMSSMGFMLIHFLIRSTPPARVPVDCGLRRTTMP